MAERWIINAHGDAPLVLPLTNRLGVCRVVEVKTPPPEDRITSAERPEGEMPASRECGPRVVTLKMTLERPADEWARVTHDFGTPSPEAEGEGDVPGFTGSVRRVDSVGNPLVPAVQDLQLQIGAIKTAARGVAATLTRVMEGGERITFDVIEVTDDGALWDDEMWLGRQGETTIEFRCLPFGRGVERLIGSGSRTTGQRLVTVDDLHVPGDVDALARIELSGATVDQRSVLYAIDQGTATLEYGCSFLPSAWPLETVAGSVNTVVRAVPEMPGDVDPGMWRAGVSLSGFNGQPGPLPVPGRWAVYVRVRGMSGTRMRLRWSAGPRVAGMTIGPTATLTGAHADWQLVPLGLVTIPDGAGLDGLIECELPQQLPLYYDQVLLVPADRMGQQHGRDTVSDGDAIAFDRLTGIGNLNGSNPNLGTGPWTKSGTATPNITRSATGAYRTAEGASVGLANTLPLGSLPAVDVRATVEAYPYVEGTAGIAIGSPLGITTIAGAFGHSHSSGTPPIGEWAIYVAVIAYWAVPGLRVLAFDEGGNVTSSFAPFRVRGPVDLAIAATYDDPIVRVSANAAGLVWQQDVDLVEPVILGAVRGGVVTHGITGQSGASIARWSRFVATKSRVERDYAVPVDGSARHASYEASRVDAAGVRGPIVPEGARPYLPASGPAGRPVRVMAMTTRGLLGQQADGAPDDPLSVDVYATPRWLQIPGVGA